MHMSKFDEPSAAFRKVSKRDPLNYQAFLLLGRSYAAQNQSDTLPLAEDAYRRAARLRPLDPTPFLEFAEVLKAHGRKRKHGSSCNRRRRRKRGRGVRVRNSQAIPNHGCLRNLALRKNFTSRAEVGPARLLRHLL